MNIHLIVAVANNYAIGKDNQMLWHLPNDFKFFKNITWGMPVLMGRKTFESLQNKALPGRINIVLTKQKKLDLPNAIVVNSIKDALFIAEQHQYKELFVIGGGELYKQTLPMAKRLYLTRVDARFDDATAFFPIFKEDDFVLVKKQSFVADEKHSYDYTIEVWERK